MSLLVAPVAASALVPATTKQQQAAEMAMAVDALTRYALRNIQNSTKQFFQAVWETRWEPPAFRHYSFTSSSTAKA
jgi:hypothetical protein